MDFLREQQLGLVSRAVQAAAAPVAAVHRWVASVLVEQLQVLVTHFFNDSFKNAFAAAMKRRHRAVYVYGCDANSATFHALKSPLLLLLDTLGPFWNWGRTRHHKWVATVVLQRFVLYPGLIIVIGRPTRHDGLINLQPCVSSRITILDGVNWSWKRVIQLDFLIS